MNVVQVSPSPTLDPWTIDKSSNSEDCKEDVKEPRHILEFGDPLGGFGVAWGMNRAMRN